MQWLINGTLFQNHLDGVTESQIELTNSLIGVLVFTNLPVHYNMTTIQCEVTLSLHSGVTFLSNIVTLLIFPGIATIPLISQ